MKREEQTEQVKLKLFQLTKQFVYKYWRVYYPAYCEGRPSKDDLDDLVGDFYIQFLTAKSREKGKEQSLLDKYDPAKKPKNMSEDTFFANLVKVSVTRMLIDRSRSDKREVRYQEKYDEDGVPTIDYLLMKAEKDDPSVDDIEFSKSDLDFFKKNWNSMSEQKRKALKNYYDEVKNVIAPNVRAAFESFINE